MNKPSERHHYLPKFYIKGFVDNENKFFVYDKKKDEIKKSKLSPKQIFFEWERNTINSKNIKEDGLEKLYSSLDSEIAKVIIKMREEPNSESLLSKYNREFLTYFVIQLFGRNPKNDFLFSIGLDKSKLNFKNKKTGKRVQNVFLENKLKDNLSYYKLWKAGMSSNIFKNFIEIENNFKHQLFEFEEDVFLIGDYPILFKDNSLTTGNFIFPICSNRIYRKGEQNLKLNLSLSDATNFNALLIDQSELYICGRNKAYLNLSVRYWKYLKYTGQLSFLAKKVFQN